LQSEQRKMTKAGMYEVALGLPWPDSAWSSHGILTTPQAQRAVLTIFTQFLSGETPTWQEEKVAKPELTLGSADSRT
jgi:hypothetical protein